VTGLLPATQLSYSDRVITSTCPRGGAA